MPTSNSIVELILRARNETKQTVTELSSTVDKLTDNQKRLTSSSDDASVRVQRLRDRLRELNDTAKSLSSSDRLVVQFREQSRAVLEASRSYKSTQNNVKQLASSLRAFGPPTKQSLDNFERSKVAVSRTNVEYERQRKTLAGLKTQLESAGLSTKKLNTAQQKLEANARRVRGAMNLVEKEIVDIGNASKRSAPLIRRLFSEFAQFGLIFSAGFLGREAIQSFIDFERGLIGVRKTTDITGQELERFGERIERLGGEVPVATSRMLELAKTAGQLGVQGSSDILKFTETLAKLELATDLAGEEGASQLARILTVTGTPTDQIDRLGSVIVQLGNNFAATESEIASVATRVAQSTAQFDLGADNVLGIATAMRAVGVEAESGGTQVGLAFQKINDALRNGGKELELLEQLTGQTGEALRSAFFGGQSAQVFQSFIDGLSRVREEGGDINRVLEEFELSNVRAVRVLGTLATRSDVLTDALSQANDEWERNVALNKEADIAGESLGAQLQIVRNELDRLGRAMAELVVPAIRQLAPLIKLLADNADILIILLGARLTASLASVAASFITAQIQAIRYSTATASLAGTSRAAAAGQTVLAGAVRASSVAMGLLGGPLGVAIAAAGALLLFSNRANASRQRAKDLADALSGNGGSLVDAFKDISVIEAKSRRLSIEDLLSDAEKGLAEAQANLKRFQDNLRGRGVDVDNESSLTRSTQRAFANIRLQIEEASKQVDKYRISLERLDDIIADRPPPKQTDDGRADFAETLDVADPFIAQTDAILEDLAEKRLKLEEKLKDDLAAISREIAEEEADTLQERLALIESEYAELIDGLKETGNDAGAGLVNRLIEIRQASETQAFNEEELANAQTAVNELLTIRQQLLETITQEQELGLISQAEAQTEFMAVNDEIIPQLEIMVEKALEMAAALGDEGAIAKLKQLQTSLKDAGATVVVTADQINQSFVDGFVDAIGKAVDGVASLKDAFRQFAADFLRQIANMILKQLVLNALQSSGFGGAVAGGVNAVANHTGGIVGRDGSRRTISPTIFNAARRWHSGGFPGLRQDEVPSILQKGEEVLAKKDPRNALNGGGASPVNVEINNSIDSGALIEQGASTRPGVKAIMNLIQANRNSIKRILS